MTALTQIQSRILLKLQLPTTLVKLMLKLNSEIPEAKLRQEVNVLVAMNYLQKSQDKPHYYRIIYGAEKRILEDCYTALNGCDTKQKKLTDIKC